MAQFIINDGIKTDKGRKTVYVTVKAENHEITFTGENQSNKKDVLEMIHNFISEIQAGKIKITDNTEAGRAAAESLNNMRGKH
jgi:hypothetical protein